MLNVQDVSPYVGLTVGSAAKISVMVNPETDNATLVIGSNNECEITLEPSALETLHAAATQALHRLGDAPPECDPGGVGVAGP
jgi:hypothetical protein